MKNVMSAWVLFSMASELWVFETIPDSFYNKRSVVPMLTVYFPATSDARHSTADAVPA
jgi:hypothetical protein